jgi:radical SAM superfamily enzyme YgiQ (UPF0313 family)
MHHEGLIIRPPSEADSILLQVTLGCTHNACAFCGAYKAKRFAIKPEATVRADIAFAARHCRRIRRVFLCDGDALSIPHDRLVALLVEVRASLPWVARVAAYANARGLRRKTAAELAGLKALGLHTVYMGLESGDEATLAAMNKGVGRAAIVEQAGKLKAAGLRLSLTVILGLAGAERSPEHARATAEALSEIDPDQAAALSLMLVPGTPLFEEHAAGRFVLPGPAALLAELRTLVAQTRLSGGLFFSNHASNYLPLRLRLPRDRDAALLRIDAALAGRVALRPEGMRGL